MATLLEKYGEVAKARAQQKREQDIAQGPASNAEHKQNAAEVATTISNPATTDVVTPAPAPTNVPVANPITNPSAPVVASAPTSQQVQPSQHMQDTGANGDKVHTQPPVQEHTSLDVSPNANSQQVAQDNATTQAAQAAQAKHLEQKSLTAAEEFKKWAEANPTLTTSELLQKQLDAKKSEFEDKEVKQKRAQRINALQDALMLLGQGFSASKGGKVADYTPITTRSRATWDAIQKTYEDNRSKLQDNIVNAKITDNNNAFNRKGVYYQFAANKEAASNAALAKMEYDKAIKKDERDFKEKENIAKFQNATTLKDKELAARKQIAANSNKTRLQAANISASSRAKSEKTPKDFYFSTGTNRYNFPSAEAKHAALVSAAAILPKAKYNFAGVKDPNSYTSATDLERVVSSNMSNPKVRQAFEDAAAAYGAKPMQSQQQAQPQKSSGKKIKINY